MQDHRNGYLAPKRLASYRCTKTGAQDLAGAGTQLVQFERSDAALDQFISAETRLPQGRSGFAGSATMVWRTR